jgi:hypothetical protein
VVVADVYSYLLQLMVESLVVGRLCVLSQVTSEEVGLQVNDAAVSLRLIEFVSKVQRFYIQNRLDGGGERGEECHPSDLLCWLTVIWSGAPTDSLGGGGRQYCDTYSTYLQYVRKKGIWLYIKYTVHGWVSDTKYWRIL